MTRIYETKYNIHYPPFIIPCKSKEKVIWDIFVLLLVLYIAIYVPYQIGK